MGLSVFVSWNRVVSFHDVLFLCNSDKRRFNGKTAERGIAQRSEPMPSKAASISNGNRLSLVEIKTVPSFTVQGNRTLFFEFQDAGQNGDCQDVVLLIKLKYLVFDKLY